MWPLLVPAAVGAALVAAQRRIIYPSFTTVSLQAHPPADAEVLRHALGGADQSVEAWFLPAYREAGGGPAPLVVFAHGNAELIDLWPQVLSPYRNLGCHVLLPEYRSYGRSGGKPSEASICADVHAFVRKIIQRPDVDSSRVVFHGRSLGGGVLGAVAQRWSPRAAILESTFTSLEDLARDMYLPGSLVFDKYRTSDWLEWYEGRVLVIHGTHDRIVPFVHADRLANQALESQRYSVSAGHNDIPRDDTYWNTVAEFLSSAGVLR